VFTFFQPSAAPALGNKSAMGAAEIAPGAKQNLAFSGPLLESLPGIPDNREA
jgi:hypothetical protein